MKRTAEGTPALSVALIVRNAAEFLEPCLQSVRERVPQAQIVVVDTMSSDATPDIARKYADVFEEYRGPEGNWTREMYAFSDAAAARQRSFDLATGKWVMWIDADDILPGPEEAERLLKLNGRWQPPSHAAIGGGQRKRLDELLVEMGEKDAALEGFWAPYLYRSDENGMALTWQIRERIVRNNGQWKWQRKAHEVLVPVKAEAHRKMATIAHLLFVHKKKWTAEDTLYSLQRHYDILIKEYEGGQRNLQDLLYLENYATVLCGERREEFIVAAQRVAFTTCDRARVAIRRAQLAAENGFFHDAVEALAGAVQVAPDYPDTHFALAALYEKAEHWGPALEWYQRATSLPAAHGFSDVPPREHLVAMRIRGSLAAREHSKALTRSGLHPQALDVATVAVELATAALNEPCIGPDKQEAAAYVGAAQNEKDALTVAQAIHAQWKYLVKNDETQKALAVLEQVPHNLLHHPLVDAMRVWARPVRKHLNERSAYANFYQTIGTDVTSVEEGLTPEGALPRVKWCIERLKELQALLGRPLRILEMGPFDGITALPVMRALPDCRYTAIEAQERALVRLRERVEELGISHRLTTYHGMGTEALPLNVEPFDAVILFEVLEHVQNPVRTVEELLHQVGVRGSLFISTPWGAFDRGHHPPNRDPRGHVRAMMPIDLLEVVANAAGKVVELGGSHAPGNYGDTMHCQIQHRPICEEMYGGVNFVVPSALWLWNASHVLATGIGASEETIVFLGAELAKDQAQDITVYGPLPKEEGLVKEEVREGVAYLANDALASLDPRMPTIVSRAPSFGAYLGEKVAPAKFRNLILWLQDAWYPDLNEKTAELYHRIVVLSEWHKAAMMELCKVPAEKLEVIPNFLLREHFNQPVKREQHRFIYASSPDRGLIRLLKMWPTIRNVFPDATLGIFYGWEGCMKLGANNPEWNARYRSLREEYLKLRGQPGVEEHGRVNHATIALQMMRADAWLYPTDFDETFCSNAIKARAAGCVPVVTPRAALLESAECPQTVWVDAEKSGEAWGDYQWRFVQGIKKAVAISDTDRALMRMQAIADYDVRTILPKWEQLLREVRL